MLKQIALAVLKSTIETWVKDRALKVPQAKEAQVAAKAHLTVEQLRAAEAVLSEYAVTQIDQIR